MGLDIVGLVTREGLHWHYGTLHSIRALVPLVKGDITVEKASCWEASSGEGKGKKLWLKYPGFYQLLHFADNEGVFVSGRYLRDVDFSESFFLGDLDDLAEELNLLFNLLTEEILTRLPCTVNKLREFKALVDRELEENGVVQFC